jgi:hypothetical protein
MRASGPGGVGRTVVTRVLSLVQVGIRKGCVETAQFAFGLATAGLFRLIGCSEGNISM